MLPWPESVGQEMEWVIPGKGLQHKKNLAQEVIKEDYVSCRVWGKSSLEEKQLEKDDTLSFLTLLVFPIFRWHFKFGANPTFLTSAFVLGMLLYIFLLWFYNCWTEKKISIMNPKIEKGMLSSDMTQQPSDKL